jgi:hypothetical protein
LLQTKKVVQLDFIVAGNVAGKQEPSALFQIADQVVHHMLFSLFWNLNPYFVLSRTSGLKLNIEFSFKIWVLETFG